MKIQKNVLVLCVLVVVVGAGSFYGGMVYGKSLNKGFMGKNFNPEQFGTNSIGMGQGGNRTNGLGTAGGAMAAGEVISQDSESITLKIQNSGTKIVFFSSSTQIMKTQQGSLEDIVVGENLTITGKANSDGSLTAKSIQIRPSIPTTSK